MCTAGQRVSLTLTCPGPSFEVYESEFYISDLIIRQLLSPADSEPLSALEMALAVEEDFRLTIQFDPAYTSDFHSRVAESLLTISYKVSKE